MSNSKTKSSVTEMMVAGILLDPSTQAPVVVLQTMDGTFQLPIWIGMAEATAIAASLKKLELNRPLTQDLLISILDHLDVAVEQVLITALKDSTYYSELVLSAGEKAIVLDCRPSDALAIALRTNALIYVNNQVIEDAKKDSAIEKLKSVSMKQMVEGEESEEDTKIQDLQYVDKSKWADILKQLNIEDFKYKA